MSRTKTEAIKKRRKIDKTISKNLQTIIIDNTKIFPQLNSDISGLRYQFRFYPKEIKLTAGERYKNIYKGIK